MCLCDYIYYVHMIYIYIYVHISFSDYCNFRALRGFISGKIS